MRRAKTKDPRNRGNLSSQDSRKKLPALKFSDVSDALRDRIIDLHPIATTIAQFYDRHIHTARVASSGLLRDAKDAARVVEKLGERELRTLKTRATRSLTRLIAALEEFEKESARMGAFAGVTSPKPGMRAKHVHLWIAGILQGEAEAHYGRGLRLPWSDIDACLQECEKETRVRGNLAKDVGRNRKGAWFREAREIGLSSGAEWPGVPRPALRKSD